MATPFGSMYFCPGQDVEVADPFGTWRGRIYNLGSRDGMATVAVTDPGTNPYRRAGERLERHCSELRLVTQ